MKLDLVYVNYFSEEILLCSLRSLVDLARRLPKEVFLNVYVVDNSFCEQSAKQTSGFITSLDDVSSEGFNLRVSYIPSDKNIGFGAACNKAVRMGTSEKIIFVNCDTLLDGCDPDGFLDLISLVDSEQVIVGPRVVDENGILHASCFSFDPISILFKPFRHLRHIGRISSIFPRYKHFKKRIDRITYEGMPKHVPSRVDWVSGCFMIADRGFFEFVAGFDDRYFLYFEDVDLCRKARQVGKNVLFSPNVSVVHTAQHESRRSKGLVRTLLFNVAAQYHLSSWLKYIWKWKRDFYRKLVLRLQRKPKYLNQHGFVLDFSVYDTVNDTVDDR